MAKPIITNLNPSFSYRESTPDEKAKCCWCEDGYPLLVDGRSEFLHSLPEPGGMMRCLAHGEGYCARRTKGNDCLCSTERQHYGGCTYWVESVESKAARLAGVQAYGKPNWPRVAVMESHVVTDTFEYGVIALKRLTELRPTLCEWGAKGWRFKEFVPGCELTFVIERTKSPPVTIKIGHPPGNS